MLEGCETQRKIRIEPLCEGPKLILAVQSGGSNRVIHRPKMAYFVEVAVLEAVLEAVLVLMTAGVP